jgi:flagellar protein FlgJ
MTPKEFVSTYFKDASDNQFGIDPYIVMTQAALESGWGEHAPGFCFFGVKDNDGINGNEQLLMTTEVSRYANLAAKDVGLEDITRIEPTTINGQKYFIYHGHGYFRLYHSAKESFDDHIKFFLSNGRYAKAWTLRSDAHAFFNAISEAGYATAPNYAQSLIHTYEAIKSIKI